MPTIEEVSDEELSSLNARHAWACGTRDRKGRILGTAKKVYAMPDLRVTLCDQVIGFSGKSVVEFGCLEGCHTIPISRKARSVLAIDFQPGNLERSRIRCGLYGVSPELRKIDLENELPPPADLFFHSGVLYHLRDPITHLHQIAPLCQELFLDTHYARNTKTKYKASIDGMKYPCQLHGESKNPRAGSAGFSRWLPLKLILTTLQKLFPKVLVLRERDERNGPRVSIMASRLL
jgi:methyltransferase family protein